MTMRVATVEDVGRLAGLDEVCFAARQWPPEAWGEVVLHPAWLTLVVETSGGELAAAAVLLRHRPLSSVASLAVAPGWRGRGIGSSLLDECISLCRRARATLVALEVDRDNEQAVRLYRRFGFRARRSFEEDGVARLEMVLALDDRE